MKFCPRHRDGTGCNEASDTRTLSIFLTGETCQPDMVCLIVVCAMMFVSLFSMGLEYGKIMSQQGWLQQDPVMFDEYKSKASD